MVRLYRLACAYFVLARFSYSKFDVKMKLAASSQQLDQLRTSTVGVEVDV